MPLDTSITEGIKIAWGWGDQFVFVVPSLDLVVVSTGSNLSGTHTDEAIQFVPEYIIKAVQGG